MHPQPEKDPQAGGPARKVQAAGLLRVRQGEWPKLAVFALFGLMLQIGLGIGLSAGDAAFLAHVGAERLPLIFLMIPAVMLIYTPLFSFLIARLGIARVADITLGLLTVGGIGMAALLSASHALLPEAALYYALRLYVGMWYIGLYTLFWNFTDSYFDIQDGKRLFPILAAGCALGNAIGGGLVSLLSQQLSAAGFMLIWAAVAAAAAPVMIVLRRRWTPIAETEVDEEEAVPLARQARTVAGAFLRSPYTLTLTLTLFVMLLLTNLAEFQYASILQRDRSEAELAGLLGGLYASASLFNILICLFVYNRLVGAIGVRNVALVLPLAYLLAFSLLFLSSGIGAALAAFYAYHTILTAIEYNNQNMLFNAVPTKVKSLVRTIVEGLCEPFASCLAGIFLLLTAHWLDLRQLAGIGSLLALTLLVVVLALRGGYPAALAANMRRGWLRLDWPDVPQQGRMDGVAIQALILSAHAAGPRERRRLEAELTAIGEIATPALVAALSSRASGFDNRILAARALASISPAQLAAIRDPIVEEQLARGGLSLRLLDVLRAAPDRTPALAVLIAYHRELIARSMDLVLTLYGLTGLLPDFELLSSSLQSTNPKIRANAIETLESGVGRAALRRMLPLLREDETGTGSPSARPALVEAAVASFGYHHPTPQAAAVQALHDLEGAEGLRRLDIGRGRTLTELARATLVRRLGLDGAPPGPTLIDRIAEVLRDPVLAQGELDAVVTIAETGASVEAAAERFPRLAFALFRARAEATRAA